MEPEHEDDLEPFRSPSDRERIWLHPSELGSLLPPAEGGRPIGHGLQPRRGRTWRALAVPVLSGMVGAALSLGILGLAGGLDRENPGRVVERVADLTAFDLREPEGAAQLAAAVAPAIVALRAATPAGERFGSGLVFRSDGHVLTNHHLVEGATSIELTGADGRSFLAQHAGSDPDSDLAVLAIADVKMEPAVLGSAETLRVGQTAIVVGAPGGPQGTPSVSAGVIAGLGEVVEVGGRPLYDLIATDATIGPRASGGPLVDRTGAVVGITTRAAIIGADENRLGLVVPIDLARRVADQLISEGRVSYPWLGMSGTDLDPWTAKEYGVDKGTLVRQVAPESPAQRAGLQVQDVVTEVERSPISTMNELMMLVRRHEPGEQLDLTVVRSGIPRTVKVRLVEAPAAL
jgi:S1-C subfamily serine protease